ncbi:MAG: hypothetical protein EXX96DRAFT_583432 [Benjaminiella poitrasii]|nr:MAG: hypothetical protein EXX96DRAFT_583432 [Benjaminiella poitrasii]
MTLMCLDPCQINIMDMMVTIMLFDKKSFFVEDDQSFDHHVACMSQDATYGGNMELAAFAKLKKVDIKVYQPGLIYVINGIDEGAEEEEEEEEEEERQVLHIAYHSWEHYSSIRNIDGPFSGPPEIQVSENKPTSAKEENAAQEDHEEEEELTSKEKVVRNACPDANIRKIRRLLIKYKGNPDKVIDALFEADSSHEKEKKVAEMTIENNQQKKEEEAETNIEDSNDKKITRTTDNVVKEEDNDDKNALPADTKETPTAPPAKKPSAAERKKEAKRRQKEKKAQKEREKAARKAKYNEEKEKKVPEDSDISKAIIQSMKEMYV